MTAEPLPAGAGVELDTLVSDLLRVDRATWEYVCAVENHRLDMWHNGSAWCYTCGHMNYESGTLPKPYSTTWAAAGEVLDSFADRITLHSMAHSWIVMFADPSMDCMETSAGETGPHAICLAFVAYKQAQKQAVESYPQ